MLITNNLKRNEEVQKITLKRSFVKRKSTGFGYIIDLTSCPFIVENPVLSTTA